MRMTQSCPLYVAKPDSAQVKALEFKQLLVRGQGVGPGVGVAGMPRNIAHVGKPPWTSTARGILALMLTTYLSG